MKSLRLTNREEPIPVFQVYFIWVRCRVAVDVDDVSVDQNDPPVLGFKYRGDWDVQNLNLEIVYFQLAMVDKALMEFDQWIVVTDSSIELEIDTIRSKERTEVLNGTLDSRLVPPSMLDPSRGEQRFNPRCSTFSRENSACTENSVLQSGELEPWGTVSQTAAGESEA